MMETILDIGLNDESVLGLAKSSGNERFAWDSYRRLVQMFGSTVMGVDAALFEQAMARAQGDPRRRGRPAPGRGRPRRARRDVQGPDPSTRRARTSRSPRPSSCAGRSWPSSSPGTANAPASTAAASTSPTTWAPRSTCRRMVFGNLGPDSGSGVAFTRDPATGARGVYGDYLANAQGEDVVAGIRNTVPAGRAGAAGPGARTRNCATTCGLGDATTGTCATSSSPSSAARLWMLQTRVGKRTAEAAFAIAAELVDEGLITPDEALARVSGERLARLMFPRFDTSARRRRARARHPGLAGRGRRRGGVRLRRGGPPCRRRREGRPRAPGDHPRRPARHDRRPGRADQPRRQDQPRRRGRPRHGQGLRVRGRGARRGHRGAPLHRGRHRRRGGHGHLRRRLRGRRLPRRRCRWSTPR